MPARWAALGACAAPSGAVRRANVVGGDVSVTARTAGTAVSVMSFFAASGAVSVTAWTAGTAAAAPGRPANNGVAFPNNT